MNNQIIYLEQCPVCKELVPKAGCINDFFRVDCARCGIYYLQYEAEEDKIFERFTPRMRANTSAWLRSNPNYRIVTGDEIRFRSIEAPTVAERMNRLLQYMGRQTKSLADVVRIEPSGISASWSLDGTEMAALLQFLSQQGKVSNSGSKYQLTADGWAHIESLGKDSTLSNQCFVAMQFTPEMYTIYALTIEPAIRLAGYDPFIVSDREHSGKIDDLIIAEIRKSKFLIADFRGHRGGVYYEAGLAHGLGKQVIWACPGGEINQLHFDVRQYNCLLWYPMALPAFRERLRLRIESVMGQGARAK